MPKSKKQKDLLSRKKMRWNNGIHSAMSWKVLKRAVKYQPLVQANERASVESHWKFRRNGHNAYIWYGQDNPAQGGRGSFKPCIWRKVLYRLNTTGHIDSLGVHKLNGDFLHSELMG